MGQSSQDPTRFLATEIETASDFQSAIEALVNSAYSNGVTVSGGWDISNDGKQPDWTVEIYQLASRGTSYGQDE